MPPRCPLFTAFDERIPFLVWSHFLPFLFSGKGGWLVGVTCIWTSEYLFRRWNKKIRVIWVHSFHPYEAMPGEKNQYVLAGEKQTDKYQKRKLESASWRHPIIHSPESSGRLSLLCPCHPPHVAWLPPTQKWTCHLIDIVKSGLRKTGYFFEKLKSSIEVSFS